MGEKCIDWLQLAVKSVIDYADKIVYIDGTQNMSMDDMSSEFKFLNKLGDKIVYKDIPFRHDYKGSNGLQRNQYLKIVQKDYKGWWCLVLDADEVVDNISKLKADINNLPNALFSIKMRHSVYDLAHEDTTLPEHFVPNRLFKINGDEFYSETEHCVLDTKEPRGLSKYAGVCIWHLSYVKGMFDLRAKYENHKKKSEIHNQQYLKRWYEAHLFGKYPNKEIDLTDLPEVLKEFFYIDSDELYFQNRGIEAKHAIMCKQWAKHFTPASVLDLGCGRGPYLYFWEIFSKVILGIELSKWAVNNSFVPGKIEQGDIVKADYGGQWDLITAIDVLEHLDDKELDIVLTKMANSGKRFLFSIPFKGDPNLLLDKTHKQFRSEEEWKNIIESKGIIVEKAPSMWLFSNQLLVGKRKIVEQKSL
jgi:2-polyprenyl-3-methyl-5-hydroxy-6-metoxy-1,4-benzoquinol methylase